jgi:hypothetical protein
MAKLGESDVHAPALVTWQHFVSRQGEKVAAFIE